MECQGCARATESMEVKDILLAQGLALKSANILFMNVRAVRTHLCIYNNFPRRDWKAVLIK